MMAGEVKFVQNTAVSVSQYTERRKLPLICFKHFLIYSLINLQKKNNGLAIFFTI